MSNQITIPSSWSFKKPDYKVIKENIRNTESTLFYPHLMDRFSLGDADMTLEEKRHLYYGYIFQDLYSPYSRSEHHEMLKALFQKDLWEETDWVEMVSLTDLILSENPFDMKALDGQLFALEELEEHERFRERKTQLQIIVDTILSTGNGLSKKEAFYVIFHAHEYDLLHLLGYHFGGSQKLIGQNDYLLLAKNETKIKGLYFDISAWMKR